MQFEKDNIYVQDRLILMREHSFDQLLKLHKDINCSKILLSAFDTLLDSIYSKILPVQKVRFCFKVSKVNSISIHKDLEKLPSAHILAVFVVGSSKEDYLKSIKVASKIKDHRVVFFFSNKSGYFQEDTAEDYIRTYIASSIVSKRKEYMDFKFKNIVEDYIDSSLTVINEEKTFITHSISDALRIITNRVFPMNFDYTLSMTYMNTVLIPKDTFSIFSQSTSDLSSNFDTYSKRFKDVIAELRILESPDVNWYINRPHSNLSTIRKYIHNYIKTNTPFCSMKSLLEHLHTHKDYALLPTGTSTVILQLCLSDIIHSKNYKQMQCLVETDISTSSLGTYIESVFKTFIDTEHKNRTVKNMYEYHFVFRKAQHKLIKILCKLFNINDVPESLIQLKVHLSNIFIQMKLHPAYLSENTESQKLKQFYKQLSQFIKNSPSDFKQIEYTADRLLEIVQGDSNLQKLVKGSIKNASKIRQPNIQEQYLPESFYWLYEFGIAQKVYKGIPVEHTMRWDEWCVFERELHKRGCYDRYKEWLVQEDVCEQFNFG